MSGSKDEYETGHISWATAAAAAAAAVAAPGRVWSCKCSNRAWRFARQKQPPTGVTALEDAGHEGCQALRQLHWESAAPPAAGGMQGDGLAENIQSPMQLTWSTRDHRDPETWDSCADSGSELSTAARPRDSQASASAALTRLSRPAVLSKRSACNTENSAAVKSHMLHWGLVQCSEAPPLTRSAGCQPSEPSRSLSVS